MSARTGKILIVEDDEPVLRFLQAQLVDAGHSVGSALSAEEAFDCLDQQTWDIILLDLRLPGMGGLEFLARSREQGIKADVIVMTGYGTIPSAVEAMKLGGFDYLEKPVDIDTLLAMVKQVLERSYDNPVVAYVNHHCNQIRSREDVARILGVNAETVSNHIVRETGQTFQDFLTHCRLERARDLLISTNLSINEIAERVGFSSPEVFARVFRKATEMAPSAYRVTVRSRREPVGGA